MDVPKSELEVHDLQKTIPETSICNSVEGMNQIQKEGQCFLGEEIKNLDAKLEESDCFR